VRILVFADRAEPGSNATTPVGRKPALTGFSFELEPSGRDKCTATKVLLPEAAFKPR
jgi:hypothetical protein